MILERLKEYIDYKNISVAAFERSIGMANASFGKSLKNKGAIGSDKLEKILMVYTDISSEWLLTGKGSMLKTKSTLETQNTSIRLYSKDKNSKKQGDLQEMHEKKLAFHVPEGSHEEFHFCPSVQWLGLLLMTSRSWNMNANAMSSLLSRVPTS